MSTIIIAALLVGIIAAICLMVMRIDKSQKHKTRHQLLHAFCHKGFEYDLNFSSQEILKDAVIGFDGVHQKLFVLKRWGESVFEPLLIDLKEVQSCSVKKEYGLVRTGNGRSEKREQYLQSITLLFVLSDKPSVEIAFYNHFNSSIYEIADLESKAKYWEAILSKMIVQTKKIA